jgi:hypothetical protein
MVNLADLIKEHQEDKVIPSWQDIDAQSIIRYMLETPASKYPICAAGKQSTRLRKNAAQQKEYILDVINKFQETKRVEWTEKITMFNGWRKRWRERLSDSGDLDISEYISRSETPFEEPQRQISENGEGVIFHVDMAIDAFHSMDSTLEEVQRRMYPIVLHRLENNLPTKIITTITFLYAGQRFPEVEFPYDLEQQRIKAFYVKCKSGITIVLKDWDTPISFATWALISSNTVANALGCWWTNAISGTGSHLTAVATLELPAWYPPVVFVVNQDQGVREVLPRRGIDRVIRLIDDNGGYVDISENPYRGVRL